MSTGSDSTISATAKTRMNFANSHLMSAALLARAVHKLETENAGRPWDGLDIFQDLLAYATGAIMTAVASLEAFLAELQFEAAHCFPTCAPEFLNKCFALVEYKPIIFRVKFFALLNGRSPPKMGQRPGQDVTALIELRHKLVHFRPEWFGEQDKHQHLSKQLNPKFFSRCPWLPNEPIFPRAWASYSCCKWAVESIRDFVMEYANTNGWACAFQELSPLIALP